MSKNRLRSKTTLDKDIDSRHSSYTKRIMETIKNIKNKNTAVVENPVKFPDTTKEVMNQYNDGKIVNLVSDAAAQIHMGINKQLVVTLDDLDKFAKDEGVFRNPEHDSIEMLKKHHDELHGFPESVPHNLRPVHAEVRHRQHDNDIAKLLKDKGGANASPDFFSESNSIKAILRKEVASRSGYGYRDFINKDTPLIPMLTKNRKLIDTCISDNAKESDSSQLQQSRLSEIIDSAVRGNYSGIVGTKDQPSFMAMIPGGVHRREIDHVEFPLSRLDISPDSIPANDGILGKTVISNQLKALDLNDAEIEKFFNSGGLIGGGSTPALAMRLMQFKKCQDTRNDLRKHGINKVKFVNPEGLDIENPRTWQTDQTATTESTQRLLEEGAKKEIASYLSGYAAIAIKNRNKVKK